MVVSLVVRSVLKLRPSSKKVFPDLVGESRLPLLRLLPLLRQSSKKVCLEQVAQVQVEVPVVAEIAVALAVGSAVESAMQELFQLLQTLLRKMLP